MERSYSETPATGQRTVLVVDDEPKIRDLVREVLEPCGFRILEGVNGRGLPDLLERTAADLLIWDIARTDLEDLEALQAIRKRRPSLKILLISGAFGGQFFGCVQRLGAHAGLKKPFSCDSLLLQVECLLEE